MTKQLTTTDIDTITADTSFTGALAAAYRTIAARRAVSDALWTTRDGGQYDVPEPRYEAVSRALNGLSSAAEDGLYAVARTCPVRINDDQAWIILDHLGILADDDRLHGCSAGRIVEA